MSVHISQMGFRGGERERERGRERGVERERESSGSIDGDIGRTFLGRPTAAPLSPGKWNVGAQGLHWPGCCGPLC